MKWTPTTMTTTLLINSGSTARDFCMLERNILSHFKLGLLLSLLSSSMLLHARLPSPSTESSTNPPGPPSKTSRADILLAAVQLTAAVAAIIAGVWEYWSGARDLRNMKAFLIASSRHTAILTVVAGVVVATCIVLLTDEKEI